MMAYRLKVRAGKALASAVLLALFGGCFDERPFPMHPGDVVALDAASRPGAGTTRDWLRWAHARLDSLLPPDDRPALLTEDLTDAAGRPVDIYAHFERDGDKMNKILCNFTGLLHSAQAASAGSAFREPVPPWPGFKDVWIPISDRLQLSGRLGLARDASGICPADCIIIMSGIFGDNAVLRTRELARALLTCGYHVLALEPRGHGRTEARYPDVYYNFGILGTGDLQVVAEWLEDMPYVRETGLIGYCWSANLVLVEAWFDARLPDHLSITDDLRPYLRPPGGRRHFRAGVIALSTQLRFEHLLDDLETPRALLIQPDLAAVQQHAVRPRMRYKQHTPISSSLRRLIECEFARSELSYAGAVADSLRFLRLLPYYDQPDGDKLEYARIPVLIVHGVNDPLARSQSVADLIARVDNPLVAAIVLPGGGHVGFAPYARSYYFSLIANFFDPACGAAALLADRPAPGNAPAP